MSEKLFRLAFRFLNDSNKLISVNTFYTHGDEDDGYFFCVLKFKFLSLINFFFIY
jgi:hypothetical protein